MKVSVDTNVWIFGIVGVDADCEEILFALSRFEMTIPDQVRAELERNLDAEDLKQFYRLLAQCGVTIDFEKVPAEYIAEFTRKGLKKGDAEIGAFCEWRGIDIFVSDNRHFLNALSPERSFQVMSPKEFCQRMLP